MKTNRCIDDGFGQGRPEDKKEIELKYFVIGVIITIILGAIFSSNSSV